MAAPLGNQFWKVRSRHGPNVIFADPVKLQEACQEYFEWCEDNPLHESVVGWHKGEATIEELPKMRAMTIGGLSIFLGITSKTFFEWKNTREDLKHVLEWAEEIIRMQKFAGAAAGLLNANIISRDLGLKDTAAIDFNIAPMVIAPPEGIEPPDPPIHGE